MPTFCAIKERKNKILKIRESALREAKVVRAGTRTALFLSPRVEDIFQNMISPRMLRKISLIAFQRDS